MENQFHDKNDIKFKLDLVLDKENKEITFTILKYINNTQDERIEEVHLEKSDVEKMYKLLKKLLKP